MSGVLYFWLPFIGLRRWTIDGHGMICAFAIFLYWCCGSSITFFCTLLPQYYAGNLSFWIIAVYAWLDIGTLISFLNAATSDPGVFAFPRTDFDVASQNYFALPNQKPAQPSNDLLMDVDGMSDLSANQDGMGMSFCEKCTHWRPKNAHHCRRCGVCVRRMDHHCPWINNCVGALNMYLFLNLLTYALLASIFTFCSNLSQLIYFNEPVFEFYVNDPFVLYRTELRIFGCIISGAMLTFMFSLLGSMHSNILFNSTTLEEMRKDFKKVTGGPGKPANAHDHSHGHAHRHSHGHSHGKAQGEGDGPESCYEHGQSQPQQNPQNPANAPFNSINEQMAFPLPRRSRDTCWNAYRKLCGRRPMIAWLIPLELNCPPPTQKTVNNVNFSLQDVTSVSTLK